jgi:hypothetical protein
MRQDYACVAGKHALRLPYIDGRNLPTDEFWDSWVDTSILEGMMLVDLLPEERGPYFYQDDGSGYGVPLHPSVLWIAGVESKRNPSPGRAKHAIVMRGNDLYWDSSPNFARTRRPTKIYWGMGCLAVKP